MRYVRGKESREARTRPPRTTGATNSFWTVSNCTGWRILFQQSSLVRVAAFGRAALHLSNQRPPGVAPFSVQERERKSGREKERTAAQLLQFRFAYIRIRGVFDRHRQLRYGRRKRDHLIT